MKRGKKMILLLCALAVLIGGYFAVQQYNKTESVSETSGTFDLTAKKPEELTGLSWTRNGTTYTFRISDGIWETLDQPAWPVNQEIVQNLADQLAGLQATRKLEDVKNLADYGLEEPAFTVEASWKDGGSTIYSMGDATPFADGYYLSLSGQDGTIYTIASSLSSVFSKTQKDMVAMEEIPSVADPIRLTVGNKLDALKESESRTVDPEQLWYAAETNEPLDGTQVESLISKAGEMAWDELVLAAASEEELAAWQLEEASAAVLTLTGSDDTSRSLLIGAQNDDGNYYARLPGSKMVYTVKSDAVESLLSASAEELWVRSVLPMPYENLVSAEFITEKGTCTLTKPAEETDGERPEDGTSEEAENAEGTAVQPEEDTTLKDLWEKVTALKAAERAEALTAGDPVLTIRASGADGKETAVVFSTCSADQYLAGADEGQPVLVAADEVDAIIRIVRTLR